MEKKADANISEVKRAGPAGGNQGAGELAAHTSLNTNQTPPVTGAPGVIGLSGRAGQEESYSLAVK